MRQTLFAVPRALLPAVLGGPAARVADTLGGRVASDVERSGVTGTAAAGSTRRATRCSGPRRRRADGTRGAGRAARPRRHDRPLARQTGGARASRSLPQVLWVLAAEGRAARAHNAGHWRRSRPRLVDDGGLARCPPRAAPAREAHAEVVRHWLHAFGPGTEADLRWWLGGTLGTVRAALADLGAVPVSLDGTADLGWLLPDDLAPVEPPDRWAALLPTLDPTVMGWRHRTFYLGGHEPVLRRQRGQRRHDGVVAGPGRRLVGAGRRGAGAGRSARRRSLRGPAGPRRRRGTAHRLARRRPRHHDLRLAGDAAGPAGDPRPGCRGRGLGLAGGRPLDVPPPAGRDPRPTPASTGSATRDGPGHLRRQGQEAALAALVVLPGHLRAAPAHRDDGHAPARASSGPSSPPRSRRSSSSTPGSRSSTRGSTSGTATTSPTRTSR